MYKLVKIKWTKEEKKKSKEEKSFQELDRSFCANSKKHKIWKV